MYNATAPDSNLPHQLRNVYELTEELYSTSYSARIHKLEFKKQRHNDALIYDSTCIHSSYGWFHITTGNTILLDDLH